MSKKQTELELRFKFDWKALDKKLEAAGGVTRVLDKIGINRSYYEMRNSDELPVRLPLLQIAEYFNMTALEFRQLFVIKPVKERKHEAPEKAKLEKMDNRN